ncbi:MAG: efflux transporter outer membrane subunit [Planctomycetes bacterium]|nr:efflux transporter outer membrane subunit [Planctomycetota bacterium]
MKVQVFLVLSLLFFAACKAVGTDYVAPEAEVAPQWHADLEAKGVARDAADLARWWERFQDPVLNDLIERAAIGSLDVREALGRWKEARALRGATAADRYPTLDAQTSYTRRAESKNTPFGNFVPDTDNFALGFDASWEIDLWGRVSRSIEAADADLQVAVEDARAVGVAVAAETARNYIELRALQRRVAIARDNVALQEQTLQLVRGLFDAGLQSAGDLAQAQANLETTRARIPTLEIGLRAAQNRLAVLLGLAPGTLTRQLNEPRPIPVPPVSVAVGVPADLLRRRADVRRAERVLAAEHARIGVAEGDLYPRLTLAGNLGFAADELSSLFTRPSFNYGYGPSLRLNLFDSGRIRNRVVAQEARTEQAFVRWERAVLTALEETENELQAFVLEQERRNSLLAAATQARLAAELSRTQYSDGISDFQSVLVSERSVTDLEDDLAASEAAIATRLVALYKALGGGWSENPASVHP